MSIYHYTYLITDIKNEKHYIGVRTSKCLPNEDLGVRYFSSSYDKEFLLNQKLTPENFQYQILEIFPSREESVQMEISLHEYFDVGRNPRFYNQVRQTSTGFDSTGFILSDETKSRISATKTGKVLSKENRMNISNGLKGKSHSAEHTAKIAKANTKLYDYGWCEIQAFYNERKRVNETCSYFHIAKKTLLKAEKLGLFHK